MSEQTMKILMMLEEGKITAAEASDLISKIEKLEEKESEPGPQPDPQHRPDFVIPNIGNIPIPPIPQIPDIGKTVNDAVREALSSMPDIGKTVDDALREAFSALRETFPGVSFGDEDGSAGPQTAHAEEGVTVDLE